MVIGLGADRSVGDFLVGAACTPVALAYRATRRKSNPGAPVMNPEHSWREARAMAATALPGVRYRRHPLWRYSLLWRKPDGAARP